MVSLKSQACRQLNRSEHNACVDFRPPRPFTHISSTSYIPPSIHRAFQRFLRCLAYPRCDFEHTLCLEHHIFTSFISTHTALLLHLLATITPRRCLALLRLLLPHLLHFLHAHIILLARDRLLRLRRQFGLPFTFAGFRLGDAVGLVGVDLCVTVWVVFVVIWLARRGVSMDWRIY